MIIKPKDLSDEALTSVLESFIHRDGTDYGEVELTSEQKLGIIKAQVIKGTVLIVYDSVNDQVNVISKEEYSRIK